MENKRAFAVYEYEHKDAKYNSNGEDHYSDHFKGVENPTIYLCYSYIYPALESLHHIGHRGHFSVTVRH